MRNLLLSKHFLFCSVTHEARNSTAGQTPPPKAKLQDTENASIQAPGKIGREQGTGFWFRRWGLLGCRGIGCVFKKNAHRDRRYRLKGPNFIEIARTGDRALPAAGLKASVRACVCACIVYTTPRVRVPSTYLIVLCGGRALYTPDRTPRRE